MQDTEFMTAKEKELTLKAWKRFVKAVAEGTCRQRQSAFTRRVYQQLTYRCSFIAHYSNSGFFEYYFEEPEDTARFFRQFDAASGCLSEEYGNTLWLTHADVADINAAMVEAAKPYLDAIYAKCNIKQRDRDVVRARRLLGKHGMSHLPEEESNGAYKNRYHFSVGNTSVGPIGMCASVLADTPEEAVDLLQAELPVEYAVKPLLSEAIEYINVYFNDDEISKNDIDWQNEGDGEATWVLDMPPDSVFENGED